MVALSFVVGYKSNSILQIESEKLLMNAAKRSANAINASLQSSYASLALTQANLQNLILSDMNHKEFIIEQEISNMADALRSNAFSFIYLKNSGLFKGSKYEFGNDEMMMLTYDSTPGIKGGVIISGASEEILGWDKVRSAISSGTQTIGVPHYFTINNNRYYVAVFAMPLFDSSSKVMGVLGVLVDLNVIGNELMDKQRSVFDGDYRALIAQDGTIVLHPNKDLQGKRIQDLNSSPSTREFLDIVMRGEEVLMKYSNVYGNLSYRANVVLRLENFDTTLNVNVTLPQESIFAPSVAIRAIIIGSAIIITAIIALVVFIIVRNNVTLRLQKLQRLSNDFFKYINYETKETPKVSRVKSNDEIGLLAKMFFSNIEKTHQSL